MYPVDVFKKIKDDYGYSRKSLRMKSRFRGISFARHMAMYLLMDACGLSSIRSGELLNRTHSGVIHGRNVIRNKIKIGALDLGPLVNASVHQVKFDNIIDDLLNEVGLIIKSKHKENSEEALIKILKSLKD